MYLQHTHFQRSKNLTQNILKLFENSYADSSDAVVGINFVLDFKGDIVVDVSDFKVMIVNYQTGSFRYKDPTFAGTFVF